MILFKLLIIISFLIIPSLSFAWGPLTHIYLGNELYSLCALLPPSIYEIIRRYRKDFIYGNIMADIIVGKKYLPEDKNSHSWEVAFDLLKMTTTKQQKAFVYGYMSHLAADTVAHNIYIANKKNFGHSLLEIKADSIIDKKYWYQAITIDKETQTRNDLFLERALERFMFSFKTNKRILKGIVFLTFFYQEKINDFIDKNLITSMPVRKPLKIFMKNLLIKLLTFFTIWERSKVVQEKPTGNGYRKKDYKLENLYLPLSNYLKQISYDFLSLRRK